MNVHKTMVPHFGGEPVLTLQEPLIYPAMLESIKMISGQLLEIMDSFLEHEEIWTSDQQKNLLFAKVFTEFETKEMCDTHPASSCLLNGNAVCFDLKHQTVNLRCFLCETPEVIRSRIKKYEGERMDKAILSPGFCLDRVPFQCVDEALDILEEADGRLIQTDKLSVVDMTGIMHLCDGFLYL